MSLLIVSQAYDDIPSDCAAKPLLEKMLNRAENPSYMERVLKGALASMYIGELA